MFLIGKWAKRVRNLFQVIFKIELTLISLNDRINRFVEERCNKIHVTPQEVSNRND